MDQQAVGTVAAVLAAVFSLWQIVAQTLRWRKQDAIAKPIVRVLTSRTIIFDGWLHMVVGCESRHSMPIVLTHVKFLRPKHTRIAPELTHGQPQYALATELALKLEGKAVNMAAYLARGVPSSGGATLYLELGDQFPSVIKISVRFQVRDSDHAWWQTAEATL